MQGHNVWILRPFSRKGPRPSLLLLDIIFKTGGYSARRKLKTNSPPSTIFHQHYTNFSCNLSGFSFVPSLHTHAYLLHKNSLYQTKGKFHIEEEANNVFTYFVKLLYCTIVSFSSNWSNDWLLKEKSYISSFIIRINLKKNN